MNLTEKQEKFCLEMVRTDNRNEAYRAAFDCKNMKQATIDNNAYKLLQRNDITTRIAELKKPLIEKAQLSLEKLLAEIGHIAFFDIREILNHGGTIKPISEWEEGASRAVESIEIFEKFEGVGINRVCTGLTKKVRLHDKISALDKLMRHFDGYAGQSEGKVNPLFLLVEQLNGSTLPIADPRTIDDEDFDDCL